MMRRNEPHMSQLLIGTQNPGKLSEIKNVLGNIPYKILSIADFKPSEAPNEDAITYADNAMIKAKYYATQTNLLTLADDSGLEVEALNWAPGILSARYAGKNASDANRRALLLAEMARKRVENRNARFVCAVAIADASGDVINVSEGVCVGRINGEERGNGGFGYDPLFIPDGYDQTFAELDTSIKNQISHRGRALAKAREFLIAHISSQP
jgi:XTP/dITP diphosphohydrolase